MKKQGLPAPEMIKSGGGAFEIRKDGLLLFSKFREHRFPNDDEIFELLRDKS